METGLEGKPWYYGLIVGLVIGVALFLLYHLKLSDTRRDDIERAQNQIEDLQQKINEGRNAEARAGEFELRVAELEAELEQLLKILPVRRQTPRLIRDLRILTDQAGFDLKTFDPAERFIDREFYRVWPIKINLRGGYHELAKFFDKISRLTRIINIQKLTLQAASGGRHSLSASFTAQTFVYKEPEPEPPPKKKSRKKKSSRRRGPA